MFTDHFMHTTSFGTLLTSCRGLCIIDSSTLDTCLALAPWAAGSAPLPAMALPPPPANPAYRSCRCIVLRLQAVAQQTLGVRPLLVKCWPIVFEAGTASCRFCWASRVCCVGQHCTVNAQSVHVMHYVRHRWEMRASWTGCLLGTHHLISGGGGGWIIFDKKCLFSNFCKKKYMLKTCTYKNNMLKDCAKKNCW